MSIVSNEFRAPRRVNILASVGTFFDRLSAARRAAAAYDELSMMSDRQLAARGLSRADIGRHIAATYLDV